MELYVPRVGFPWVLGILKNEIAELQRYGLHTIAKATWHLCHQAVEGNT